MATATADYAAKYGPHEPLTAAEYYGRRPVLSVDVEACKRAAVRETDSGMRFIIHGHARSGSLKIRLASIRLSIALGNQSIAETYLGSHDYPAHRYADSIDGRAKQEADAKADAGALDAAVDRDYPHPALMESYSMLRAKLEESRRSEF